MEPTDHDDNVLKQARRKIVEKNERLKRLRDQLIEKDRELAELRTELAKVHGAPTPLDLPNQDVPLFFVVGRGKSGTTWLQKTLDSHPEVLCRGEGRFFERNFLRMVPEENLQKSSLKTVQPTSLYAALAISGDLERWMRRSVWTGGEGLFRHLGNLNRLAVHYFLTDALARAGKKDRRRQDHVLRRHGIREIGVTLPEARVVHMIRDGRDHAVSMIHHMWNNAKDAGGFYDLGPGELTKRDAYRSGSLPPDESLFTEKRLHNIARAWGSQVGRAVDEGPRLLGGRYLEVHYEDLLANTEEELARVLVFIGATADAETVRRCVEGNTFSRYSEGRQTGEEESSSFYRKGVAGDWRSVFNEGDKRVFKAAAGDTLRKVGYETDDDW